MSEIRDDDGTLLERGPDGDLRPVHEEPTLPALRPGQLCTDRDHAPARPAATCSACWAEIRAGDRPRTHLGRPYEGALP